MARWTKRESRLPFKQDTLRVRGPSALPFWRRPTGRATACYAVQVQVRILPPERCPRRPNRSGPRPYRTVRCGFKSRRGHRGGCPGSSTEERLSYKQEVRGSTPRSGTVVVVYRLCTRDRGSRGPGSTPGSHPTGARRRRRVGPACKAGACLRGFESLRSHHTLVAQRIEHQVPSLKAASSILAEGTHGRMSEWSKELVCKTSHAGSIPAAASYAIHCGPSQAGAGCPAAPHKGGAPGSTPGPATDG